MPDNTSRFRYEPINPREENPPHQGLREDRSRGVRSPRETVIRLRLRRREKGNDRTALVEVADEGPGIAPDKVFERFYRIDKARSREEGAGLGLAIARWAVERQGGRIELDSAPGAGSVFRVVLPAGKLNEV